MLAQLRYDLDLIMLLSSIVGPSPVVVVFGSVVRR